MLLIRIDEVFLSAAKNYQYRRETCNNQYQSHGEGELETGMQQSGVMSLTPMFNCRC